jgi:succinate dehydrogenase / fumarate reductase cytochrome b subunit
MSALLAPEDTPRTIHGVAEPPPAPTERRSALCTYSRIALAVTGFIMAAFVIVHTLGNLLAFAGAETFNAYAHSLRAIGAQLVGEQTLLWAARVVLAATVVVHLSAHVYLVTTVPVARWFGLLLQPVDTLWESPSGTKQDVPPPPWYARLPLVWLEVTGGLIVLFVAVHLAQLTIGSAYPGFVPGDAYENLVGALGYWSNAVLYMAAAIAVGAHLLPGLWTGMRTLGLSRPGTEAVTRAISVAIPLILIVGMSTVPVAVLFRLLT